MLGFVSLVGLVLTWAVKALRVLAKFTVFLIVKMGMWLPAAYCAGYILVCSSRDIPLGDPQALRALWIGVVVLAAVGLIVSNVYQEYHRRKKKFGTIAPELGLKRQAGRNDEDFDDEPAPQVAKSYIGEERESEYARGYRDAIREREREREREFERERERERDKERQWEKERALQQERQREQERINGKNYESTGEQEQIKPSVCGAEGEAKRYFEPVPDRFSQSRQGLRGTRRSVQEDTEHPLVFATRKDPNILVVEYSDRLVYFRKNPNGGPPEFITSEYKTGY